MVDQEDHDEEEDEEEKEDGDEIAVKAEEDGAEVAVKTEEDGAEVAVKAEEAVKHEDEKSPLATTTMAAGAPAHTARGAPPAAAEPRARPRPNIHYLSSIAHS